MSGVGDAVRMQSILTSMERVYCELSPGDAVFFHANALHKSDANTDQGSRWAFISVYNAATNAPCEIEPIYGHDEDAPPTPYAPLEKCTLNQVLELGRKQLKG